VDISFSLAKIKNIESKTHKPYGRNPVGSFLYGFISCWGFPQAPNKKTKKKKEKNPMPSIKNTLAELKKHPGQPGNNDDHKYKRTYSLDVTLSPIELEAFRNEWIKSEFNSLASFARYKFFGGAEHKIELYFEKRERIKFYLVGCWQS
jgi:hypothetical protein